MPSIVNLKAQGLVISPNQLEVPAGSMSEANNIVIRRDNVVESRRGFKLFGNDFGSISDRAKQLLFYKNRLLRHYASTLQFEANDNGQFNSFSGSFSETEEGLRIKGIEVISNFYFTTSTGIKKISADTNADFTTAPGYITNAGGIKAIDLTGSVITELGNQSGFMPQDSKVAYRVVWGIRDNNNNLVLGTPSQRIEVVNSLNTLLIQDFLNVLHALDEANVPGSLITDGDYVQTFSADLQLNATPSSVRNNLIALTSKIDDDIVYTEGAVDIVSSQRNTVNSATVIFNSSVADMISVGDSIAFSNFTNVEFNSRIFTVTGVSTTTLTASPDTDFTGTDVAPIVESVSALAKSNNYNVIPEPPIPSTPATDDELKAIQTYLSNIILRLQTELSGVIPTYIRDSVFSILDVTTTANVRLDIKIPQDVTSDYFYQVYRSAIVQATGAASLDDISPDDELKLVIEDFPSAAELAAREVIVVDQTPDEFRGANLYTNPSTGEGILQANDIPPFAKDIALYQGVTFYANTKTRHRKSISLLGVQGIIDDYNAGNEPSITITNGTLTNTYKFVVGAQEITDVTVPVLATGSTINGTRFNFWSAEDTNPYQTFYNTGILNIPVGAGSITITTNDAHNLADGDEVSILNSNSTPSVDGTYIISGTTANTFNISIIDPVTVAGNYGRFSRSELGKSILRIDLDSADTFVEIAQKTSDGINGIPQYFTSAVPVAGTLEIANISEGAATNATDVNTGFTFNIIQNGVGQNAALKQILLSSVVSPAQAVDNTARSIISVINSQINESVYAYYLSGPNDVPGQMLFESRGLSDTPFYIVASDLAVGNSFEPSINPITGPAGQITSIGLGVSPTITTASAHGFVNGDKVILVGTNSTPSADGLYTVSGATTNTFVVDLTFPVTVVGTTGRIQNAVAAAVSENESRANRIYYSKIQQPEAVPITNYFEVGPEDFQILRIFPLRDSLFVFKEDGLYRVSGETAPFSQALFNSSCILTAPDSISVANDLIYAWTRLGIVTVSETGVSTISRPIDTQILEIGSANYPNFKTLTWGVGYESDNSYIVWTNIRPDDTEATIAYRYSNLTRTWTTYSKTNTCGIVKFNDDRLYLGAGDINRIEQERKTFKREDFADREYNFTLDNGNYKGASLIFSSIEHIEPGDVLTQSQTLNVYQFNSLLRKIDADPQIAVAPISSISAGVNSTITTTIPHNILINEYVRLINTNSVPVIDGTYKVLSVPTSSSLVIKPINQVLVAGTMGTARLSYQDSLKAVGGDNLRTKLVALTNKMDTDPGLVFTDYSDRIGTKTGSITSTAAGNPSVVTTSGNHSLLTTRVVSVGGTTGGNPTANGTYQISGAPQGTFGAINTFTIPVNALTGSTGGSYSTVDQSFDDVVACFNIVIARLNVDTGAALNNYQVIDITNPTILEAVVLSINKVTKQVTLNLSLDFVTGPMLLFKAIQSSYTYTPITFGDPLNWKQVYQATLLFQNKAFTKATLAFKTDLLPEFIPTEFFGDGNGIFGIGTGPFGNGFFGGGSNAAPFRTTLPGPCIRCRFLEPRYIHSVAREKYAIYGLTLTSNDGRSERAYR